jgi:hypothetical protein
MPTALDVLVA